VAKRNVHNRQNTYLSYFSQLLSSRPFVRCASFHCLCSVVLVAILNNSTPVNRTAGLLQTVPYW